MLSITSLLYIIFLIASMVVYYLLPKKLQWIVLLTASVVFYVLAANEVWTVVYLLVTVVVTWLMGAKLDEEENPKRKKLYYLVALFTNLAILFALKYANFFLKNAGYIVSIFSREENTRLVSWPAALGLSFYTLQIVGYLTDCYWGISKPQKNIAKLALFTMFFPQMTSGPISRYQQLSEELYKEHKFEWINIRKGLLRILVGLCKKLILAENLNTIVKLLLDKDNGFGWMFVILGIALYVLQIYADFSGCMDIVTGSAECFGITMAENFDKPFSSRSIQEFWQRWHITLGLWLRDYVMYPILRSKAWNKMTKSIKSKLGKKAAKMIPTYIAMLVLWFCMGLWHGGGWNYVLEGVWFWAVIVLGQAFEPLSKKITGKINTENRVWILFQQIRTTVIYAIGAMLFYNLSVKDGITTVISAISVDFSTGIVAQIKAGYHLLFDCIGGYNDFYSTVISSVMGFVVFVCFHFKRTTAESVDKLLGKSPAFQYITVVVLIFLIVMFGCYGPGYNASDFIYGGF